MSFFYTRVSLAYLYHKGLNFLFSEHFALSKCRCDFLLAAFLMGLHDGRLLRIKVSRKNFNIEFRITGKIALRCQ